MVKAKYGMGDEYLKGLAKTFKGSLEEAKKQDLTLDYKILLGTAATPQDGSEMIVWGGYNSSQLNTGGRYNPSTDSWTATSTTNVPSARQSHTAVWTGSEMIIWGGYFLTGAPTILISCKKRRAQTANRRSMTLARRDSHRNISS